MIESQWWSDGYYGPLHDPHTVSIESQILSASTPEDVSRSDDYLPEILSFDPSGYYGFTEPQLRYR